MQRAERARKRLLTSDSLKVAWPDAQARLSSSRETVSQEHGLDLLPDFWQSPHCQPRVTISDCVDKKHPRLRLSDLHKDTERLASCYDALYKLAFGQQSRLPSAEPAGTNLPDSED
jgi:hypothetical protein